MQKLDATNQCKHRKSNTLTVGGLAGSFVTLAVLFQMQKLDGGNLSIGNVVFAWGAGIIASFAAIDFQSIIRRSERFDATMAFSWVVFANLLLLQLALVLKRLDPFIVVSLTAMLSAFVGVLVLGKTVIEHAFHRSTGFPMALMRLIVGIGMSLSLFFGIGQIKLGPW